ncbi:unnamed protein product [Didymodactylos carnosus]|uniref:HTH CENPB-type domain-containing protein n=1 Tax=Didymodactylos carnosus TaxID=1234261 RepID=A0A814QTV0_9BILA|nr:unnamed protein product [Didymodactylos carnosus]CAF3887693.1 unnamed protein product [Didymodactylos carnosus]
MPRTFIIKGRDPRYLKDYFEAALREISNGSDIRAVGRKYNIPFSTLQLHNVSQAVHLGTGRSTHFTDIEETYLVNIVAVLQGWGEPITPKELVKIATSYAKELGKYKTFKNGQPTIEWYYTFMKRHPQLTTAKSIPLELRRAKITQTIKQGGTGGKSYYSVLFCVSASGVILPPYTIYKAKKLYGNWCLNDPTGAGFNTSANGWMEDNVFYEWFKNMFLPLTSTTPKLILLILDGHTSHRRVRTTELAITNGIVLLRIPPHSTHIFQPHDVTFFKPIKQKYREILAEYYAVSGYEKVSKSTFPSLLLKLFQSTAIKNVNIIKGFIETGIYPLDKSAIRPQKILKCNHTLIIIFSLFLVTIHMDLSRASESTIEVVITSVSPLSPRAAIYNALLSMRPPVIEQPPTKKLILDPQAGQLLTCEEALRQMREKEEGAVKKAKPVQKRTSVKQKKNSKAKKLCTIEDVVLDTLHKTMTDQQQQQNATLLDGSFEDSSEKQIFPTLPANVSAIVEHELNSPCSFTLADIQAFPTLAYFNHTVIPIIIEGLTQVAKERPPKPIEYLACFLIKNKERFGEI